MKKGLRIAFTTLIFAMVIALCSCDNVGNKNYGDVNAGNSNIGGNNGYAHIHSFGDWQVVVNSTCEKEGEKERFCSCGETQKSKIAVAEHDFGEWQIVKNVTCKSDGEMIRSCNDCIYKEKVIQISDGTEHIEVVDEAVAPTYESSGLTEGRHCSVCNSVLIEQQVIPVLATTYHSIIYKNIKDAEYPVETAYSENVGMIDLPEVSSDGYKFLGWYTASIGGEIVDYIPSGSTKDYVLFAHWELETYNIIYKKVPNNTNPISYNIEDTIILSSPKWSGLVFTYWTDEYGNVYTPSENVAFLPSKITGDLVLTANWKVLRNIATPSEDGANLFNTYSAEDGILYFFYDLGTIEHVVLDNIDPNLYYKSEGMPLNLTLSETVTISEETAQSIVNTVSTSISKTKSWEEVTNWATTHTSNWNAQLGANIEVGIGGGALLPTVKGKIEGFYNWGGGDSRTDGWSDSKGGSSTGEETESKSVSSSISYKKEITSEIIENYYISEELPSGYYAYVHAGNIRVIAIVRYDTSTGALYLNTYSHLDSMHSMIMYYEHVNQLNQPEIEGLDFTVFDEQIINTINDSCYVEYDSNGGVGTMSPTMYSVSKDEGVVANTFTRDGYTFVGWEIDTDSGIQILKDEQKLGDFAEPLKTVTLRALWTPNLEYTLDIEKNTYSVTGLGDFNGTELEIPNTYNGLPVTSICASLFDHTKSSSEYPLITSLTIPENITTIGDNAFSNCKNLEIIKYNATNITNLPSYPAIFMHAGENGNGIIVEVGDNVEKIPSELFATYESGTDVESQYAPKIISLKIGKNSCLESIGAEAFIYCNSLESVVLPSSLKRIDSFAFYFCANLKHVYYMGTMEEWDSIQMGQGNSSLENAITYYSYHS